MAGENEWNRILDRLAEQLSDEEKRIVSALAEGKSRPDIARMLGQYRSMIWRRIQRIRERYAAVT